MKNSFLNRKQKKSLINGRFFVRLRNGDRVWIIMKNNVEIVPSLREVFYKNKTLLKLTDCCANVSDFVPIPIGNNRGQPTQVLKIIG